MFLKLCSLDKVSQFTLTLKGITTHLSGHVLPWKKAKHAPINKTQSQSMFIPAQRSLKLHSEMCLPSKAELMCLQCSFKE